MKNLTLAEMQNYGIYKYMSTKEIDKVISNALIEQNNSFADKDNHAEKSLENVLVHGGLFTYALNKKKYKINVLTKEDMQLLDNIENLIEEGIEYDIAKPYKFHCLTAHDTYLTVKAKDYTEAQILIDNILGKGLYKASASKL